MGNHNNKLLRLMVIGCALSASLLAAQVQAEGNGVVVLTRDVKTRQAFRNDHPDPSPTTVNTNPSARIVAQTNNELSDGDFANVASGATINRLLVPDASSGGVRGINAVPSTLPGLGNATGGGGGGAGGSISNSVNSGIQRGLAPLQILTGGK